MQIKKISLCQSEKWDFDIMPRGLNSDYDPLYEFKYPFSKVIALDCERIVFKLKENNICSDICFHLVVTFVDSAEFDKNELIEFIAFGQKTMRFVNVGIKAVVFNSMDKEEKRRFLINSIGDAIIKVVEETRACSVWSICEEVSNSGDNTECIFLEKHTKVYDIFVKFTSSLKGYTAKLYIKNNRTGASKNVVLLDNVTFANLINKIHKISIKNNQCIIQPTSNYEYDEQIFVTLV